MTYFNLSGPAGDHEHAERGTDSEGSEEAMTNEEKLGEEEQPEARAQIKYKEGLNRIYVVFVVCWVAFFLMFPVGALLQREPGLESLGVGFLAALVIPIYTCLTLYKKGAVGGIGPNR